MTLVGDTFRGYPDLKLNNAYGWFKKRFDVNIAEIAHSRKKIIKALHIPQGIIECYVVVGMILFVFIGGNNSDTRIILGVLSVAVLRILPSLRTIITKVIHLKDNAFTIDIIKNINLPIEDIKKHIQPVNFQEQIKIDNITFGYPATGTYIFNNFSLNIKKGECIGIQGISGIGKTTLFNLLLGFYEPQGGKIQIDDILLNKETYPAWQKLIAYVPQDIFIMDASLAENIAFGAEDINNDQLLSVIEKSGMKHYVSALPEGVHTRIGQNGSRLSGGERQRVGIARALYKKAEILLFDEATSSLDIKTEKDITDTINRLSKEMNDLTIIIISHKQSTLRICDRVFIISK
ncbi:MAG: ABC transporter ATP-binding protein/permease [Prevotella sp.]|nr:ABC transporter ATP-binding protein/permease [Prevotella sp.]